MAKKLNKINQETIELTLDLTLSKEKENKDYRSFQKDILLTELFDYFSSIVQRFTSFEDVEKACSEFVIENDLQFDYITDLFEKSKMDLFEAINEFDYLNYLNDNNVSKLDKFDFYNYLLQRLLLGFYETFHKIRMNLTI